MSIDGFQNLGNLPVNGQVAPNIAGFSNATGLTTDLNTQTGDAIFYDPYAQTAHSGTQSAFGISIGPETLTQFGNGATTVNDRDAGTLSVENGNVYGVHKGETERKLLGLASDEATWTKARSDGYVAGGAQGDQEISDLRAASSGGLLASEHVQNAAAGEFGLESQQDLNKLHDLLALLNQTGTANVQAAQAPAGIPAF